VPLLHNLGGRRRSACIAVAGLLGLLVVAAAVSAASARGTLPGTHAARGGVERVVFIDHGRPARSNAQTTTATAAATDFRLLSGQPSWNRSVIHYSVSTTGCSNDCSGAVSAVDAAFDAWQVSGLNYARAGTGDADPCGGTDSVSWTPIDGDGGILASTSVCQTLGHSKQIVGFQTVFDSGDTWSDSGASGKFDIQATATHEEGHTTGLDHVRKPADARLTMYPYITDGDTGFRTLGCGDRLGVNALYGTNLSCTGVPLD
jgi:hypothetical protein